MSNSVDLCCLQKPIIITCGSERVKMPSKISSRPQSESYYFFYYFSFILPSDNSHEISRLILNEKKKKINEIKTYINVVCWSSWD